MHALNLYNSNGFKINRPVLKVIKQIFQSGGRFTMKIPMQEIWDQKKGVALVALNEKDDSYRYNKQCEQRLRHEERLVCKFIKIFHEHRSCRNF